nr:EOG090X0EPT [Sida crystallina]
MSQPAEPPHPTKSQSRSKSGYKSGAHFRDGEADFPGGSSSSLSKMERKYRDKDRRSGYSGNFSSATGTKNEQASTIATAVPVREPSSKGMGLVMSSPVKMLNEELLFVDTFGDFLGDNPDFLVVGCVGLQWSGKSSVLSHLATSDCSSITRQTVFNISTTSHQMKGESSTIGLDAYISSERVIWLDCQPLLSAAVAERELASSYSKEAYKEPLSKMEASCCVGTTVEVESLQMLSFLYCICHVLLVVQDSLADPNLVRLLQTAEMLKPNMSTDESGGDHMPHLITLYNRGQPTDLVPEMMDKTLQFYRRAFAKSRLQIASRLVSNPAGNRSLGAQHTSHLAAFALHHDDINFVPLLDWSLQDEGGVSYDQIIPPLKRALLALPRTTFGPPALTEKTW